MSNALNITPKNHGRCIETENAMILMGNYYQKEDMSCISKKGCIFNNLNVGNNTLHISRLMNITGGNRAGYRDKMFDITKDPYIENRYYYLLNNHYSSYGNYSSIIIAEEDGEDINVIATAGIDTIDWERIFDIDQNYIYATGTLLSRFGTYMYKINKQTGTCNVIYQLSPISSRVKCDLIYKNETYFYFTVRYNAGCVTYLIRYNKSNGEVVNLTYTAPDLKADDAIYSYNNDSLWMTSNLVNTENFYQENNIYYWCMPQCSGNSGTKGNANNNLMIMRFDVSQPFNENNKNNVLTFRTTNGIQNNENLKWANCNGYCCYRFWIIDNYMYYAIYEESNAFPEMYYVQGIHVFKINKGFELEYIDKIQITTQKQIISMVYSSDKKNLLIGYYNSFEIYLYDEESHLYKPANKEITNIASVGFDSMDRLWYQDLNGGVFVENLDDPQYVTVKFERLYYTYEGNDIDTYITFEAKSFTDKVPNGLYTLRLTGNAHFKDNGIKSLTISYTGGTEKLDIVVTGPKRIVCDVEFQKVW